jgi:vacuolar-type H+-ATPase subunit I/STV1
MHPWHYAKAYEALAKLKALHPQLSAGVTGSAKGTKHGQVWVYILVAHTGSDYENLLQRLGGEEVSVIGDLESQIAEITSAIDEKYRELRELEAKLESLRLKLQLERAKREVTG